MAAAEWHNRRLLARLDCEDEDDEGCEDVGKVRIISRRSDVHDLIISHH